MDAFAFTHAYPHVEASNLFLLFVMGQYAIELLLLKISHFVRLVVVLDCTYYRSICMNMLCFVIYYLRLFIYMTLVVRGNLRGCLDPFSSLTKV